MAKGRKPRKPKDKPVAPGLREAYAISLEQEYTNKLEICRNLLEVYDKVPSDVRVHINQDNSVDAEWRAYDIPRGLTVRRAIFMMQRKMIDVFKWHVRDRSHDPFGTWISVGLRYLPRESEIHAARISGTLPARGKIGRAFSHYQRFERMPDNYMTAAKINGHLMEHRRRKADQIVVRLHYSPEMTKPIR